MAHTKETLHISRSHHIIIMIKEEEDPLYRRQEMNNEREREK